MASHADALPRKALQPLDETIPGGRLIEALRFAIDELEQLPPTPSRRPRQPTATDIERTLPLALEA